MFLSFDPMRAAEVRRRCFLLLLGAAFCCALPLKAIEVNMSSFNTTAPTNTDIANWQSGWAGSGVTGWNYVGQINGASGVYLGNGWVLTAGHVGAGNFLLGGTTYLPVSGSATGISDANGTADLTLFRISTTPALPSLTLTLADPTVFSTSAPGTSVAMLGYGGGHGETWGYNTVTETPVLVDLHPSYPFVSTDLLTDYGTITYGSSSITNPAFLVVGDSGGGDFIYDAANNLWELEGINEVNGSITNPYNGQTYPTSGMVQLSTYATQISSVTGATVVPEPETWASLILGLIFMGGYSCYRRV